MHSKPDLPEDLLGVLNALGTPGGVLFGSKNGMRGVRRVCVERVDCHSMLTPSGDGPGQRPTADRAASVVYDPTRAVRALVSSTSIASKLDGGHT